MSQSLPLPPNRSLVAIVLIVKSQAGPRFVFHWPPNPRGAPLSVPGGAPASSGTGSADIGVTSERPNTGDDDYEDDDDNVLPGYCSISNDKSRRQSTASTVRSRNDNDATNSRYTIVGGTTTSFQQARGRSLSVNIQAENDRPNKDENAGNCPPDWEYFFGKRTYIWEKLLSPSESFNKRRFELQVNDMAFIGWPVFGKPNGTWSRTRRRTQSKPNRGSQDVPKVSELSALAKREPTDDALSSESERDEDVMTMFNVVFVLNPPHLEYHLRVKEQYHNIVRKFGKGLQSEQARADYVWEQAKVISQIKEKARETKFSTDELYQELQQKSSLVRAVASIYDSISTSRIASVTLTPDVTMSFQIPPITSTSHLPNALEPSYPGLWLTSSENIFAEDHDPKDNTPKGSFNITANQSALLPLMNENEIVSDLDLSDSRSLGPVIAHFLRISKANKSFAQVAAMSGLSLEVVQLLANHLVYWRRARVIAPLNKQATYMVSPNADLSKLAKASAAFAAEFPTSPSLPRMLALLSGTPVPYCILIPSRDHKDLYYSILAWLLRGAWVTQLRTFAWIKVGPSIKKTVQASVMREAMSRNLRSPLVSDGGNGDGGGVGDDERLVTQQEPEGPDPGERSSLPSEEQVSDEESVYSDDSHHSAELAELSERNLRSTSLILRPNHASPLESRWLDEIASRFPRHDLPSLFISPRPQSSSNHDNNGVKKDEPGVSNDTAMHDHEMSYSSEVSNQQSPPPPGNDDEDPESDNLNMDNRRLAPTSNATDGHALPEDFRAYWRIFVRYYNGSESLESIALREGMRRKIVRRVISMIDAGISPPLAADQESRLPLSLRLANREKVVVTVRHW